MKVSSPLNIKPLLSIDLKECTYGRGSFDGNMMSSPHRGKVFSLVPFMIESAFTEKNFVLSMNLFPNAKYLKLEMLTFTGVETEYVPVAEMIPITKYDYWACHNYMPFFKQHQTLDLDMVYAHKTTKEMYLFDKEGEWHDDGVNHDVLSMDQRYKETDWYDEFNVHNF